MYYHNHLLRAINGKAFEFSVKTDNAGTSNNDQVTIPTTGIGYNYNVDWGDGTTDTGVAGSITHTFTGIGTFTVKITGQFPRIFFNDGGDKDKLIDISQWGDIFWDTFDRAFFGCSLLTGVSATDAPDLTLVTDVNAMFATCTGLTTEDWSLWDVSTVTNMNSIVSGCSGLTSLNLSGWDVTSVTDLSTAFLNCSGLITLNVTGWVLSSATTIFSAWEGCSSLITLDGSAFAFGALTNMESAFEGCAAMTTLDVSGWNTSTVTNMIRSFFNCTVISALDVSSWNVAAVTSMTLLFAVCPALTTLNVSIWNVAAVTNMNSMCSGNTNLATFDVTSWTTTALTDLNSTWNNCVALSALDLSGLDVTGVTTCSNMCVGITMTTLVYDAILVAWDGQALQSNVPAHFGNSQFTLLSAAATARANMISSDLWTITDGGGI